MEAFKAEFGGTAGASLLFTGPVQGAVRGGGEKCYWQDASLVQYDTIWHYAWIPSSGIDQQLN